MIHTSGKTNFEFCNKTNHAKKHILKPKLYGKL